MLSMNTPNEPSPPITAIMISLHSGFAKMILHIGIKFTLNCLRDLSKNFQSLASYIINLHEAAFLTIFKVKLVNGRTSIFL